jgi:hypothetical protein
MKVLITITYHPHVSGLTIYVKRLGTVRPCGYRSSAHFAFDRTLPCWRSTGASSAPVYCGSARASYPLSLSWPGSCGDVSASACPSSKPACCPVDRLAGGRTDLPSACAARLVLRLADRVIFVAIYRLCLAGAVVTCTDDLPYSGYLSHLRRWCRSSAAGRHACLICRRRGRSGSARSGSRPVGLLPGWRRERASSADQALPAFWRSCPGKVLFAGQCKT